MAKRAISIIFLALAVFAGQYACEDLLEIITHEHYMQFKNHEIGNDYDVVHIESTAHPSILLEVKHFVHFPQQYIRFKDNSSNTVYLFPRDRKIYVSFLHGINLLAPLLPLEYKEYEIHYNHEAVLTAADLDALFSCEHAYKVWLGDAFYVDGDLEGRVEGLKHMKELQAIYIHIGMPKRGPVQMHPFLLAPKLEIVDVILPSSMTSNQQQLFADYQKVPHPWHLERNGPVLHFKKVQLH